MRRSMLYKPAAFISLFLITLLVMTTMLVKTVTSRPEKPCMKMECRLQEQPLDFVALKIM